MVVQETDSALLRKTRLLASQVGHTPLIQLKNLSPNTNVSIWAKEEWKQLSGSVKCRAAYQIILDAIIKEQLDEHRILLDATSGNTGIAYAAIGKQLGLRVSLCLPENASAERKSILSALGAEIIFTSKFEGTDGAQLVAKELAEKHPEKYFYADQYKNENNWKAHYLGTGEEIIKELPAVSHFVAGLGTTGSFTGTGRRLRKYNPAIRLTGLQPDLPLHGLEGWKHLETAIVPGIYDPELADEIYTVSTEEAYDLIRKIWKQEQVLLSPSSAANIAGAIKLAETIQDGFIVTLLPDNADKYSDIIKKIL